MPWTTPTLKNVRDMVRGEVTAKLAGATFVGNSVLRVVADATAALAHLVLRYIDWLADQFLPDTSETEWLDRHGNIWLKNADGSTGRKAATIAVGSVTITGIPGTIVPQGTALQFNNVQYETLEQVELGSTPTPVGVQAIDAGVIGNLDEGTQIDFVTAIPSVDGSATVVTMNGGTDQESDNDLRLRVLERIQQPPMGGAAYDYIAWAKAVPGVTRAWCFPNEMGIGTVTVRFMCDELRADNDGFPTGIEEDAVTTYIDQKRPVAIKDRWCLAPIPLPLTIGISDLVDDSAGVRANIETSLEDMLMVRASPGQTIYRSWVDEAIARAIGEDHHDLTFSNTSMPSPGHMATLGTITYEP